MSVTKLGVVGIDGSHCYEFTKVVNGNVESGARVLSYWSAGKTEKENKAAAVLEDLGASAVARMEDMIGQVDAVLVTPYNHKAYNYPYALPFVRAGVPTYVDKILAYDILHAIHLIQLSEKSGAPLIADSALRYVDDVRTFRGASAEYGVICSGVVAGPGDITRYGHHTVRMMYGLFGSGVDWVSNSRDADKDVAVVHYRDGKDVTMFLHRANVLRGWRYLVFGKNRVEHVEVDTTDIYRNLVLEIVRVLKGDKAGPPQEELLEIVGVLEAMRISAPTGQRVYVPGLLAQQRCDP